VSNEYEREAPEKRCRDLITVAAVKSAALAGGLALPPGPLGLLTIIPDLAGIWRIQSRLVADIAYVYGQTAFLTTGNMLSCLFRHAAGQAVRDVGVRAGQRIAVRQATLRAIRQTCEKSGARVFQRAAVKTAARWLPLAGAGAVAAYAYWDTVTVGRSAMELFAEEFTTEARRGRERKTCGSRSTRIQSALQWCIYQRSCAGKIKQAGNP